MMDIEGWLIPVAAKKALIVSDTDWGLQELSGLFETLGGNLKQSRQEKIQVRKIDPGSYIGKGKLEEFARVVESEELELLLVDFDLSPSQMKEIEKTVKKLVLDRSAIILEIFHAHAKSKEAKMQVDLARLEYFLPRLSHMWTHFERQSGAGGSALKGRGMGEKQIEVDRRLVKDQMNLIRKKLVEVEEVRQRHRNFRKNLLKVALVGYTNAGKSTLLNRLTDSEVLVEDALFATLDASVRMMNPKSRPLVLAIDTVGFIDRLPHSLVASFRSTLGEVLEADLLVHVLDGSSTEMQRHFEVTMNVLEELDAGAIPMMLVCNKMDACADANFTKIWATGICRERGWDTPFFMSALNPQHIEELRPKIMKHFEKLMDLYEIVVPFEDGKTAALIHECGNVEAKRVTEKGTFFRFRTLPQFAKKLNLERYKI